MQDAKTREARDHKINVRNRQLQLLEAAAAAAAAGEAPAAASEAGGASAAAEAASVAPPRALDEAAALEQAEAEWARGGGAAPLESEALERELERADVPAAEARAERERLMAEGFVLWSRHDHKALVTACERFESDQRSAIIAEVCETTDKPPEEVERYYAGAWAVGGGPWQSDAEGGK